MWTVFESGDDSIFAPRRPPTRPPSFTFSSLRFALYLLSKTVLQNPFTKLTNKGTHFNLMKVAQNIGYTVKASAMLISTANEIIPTK